MALTAEVTACLVQFEAADNSPAHETTTNTCLLERSLPSLRCVKLSSSHLIVAHPQQRIFPCGANLRLRRKL